MSLVTILLLCLTLDPLIKTGIATITNPDHSLGGSNETDLEALLAFNSKITQDPKGALRSWNKSIDFCQWQGVVCDGRHKRVTALNLPAKHLVGTLSPFIGNLSFLQQLDLFNNSFSGHLPPQVGRLLRLQTLTLINNAFDGEIPTNISQCLQLNKLELSNNYLEGRIPPELSLLTSLQVLALDYNNLTGEVSTAIANMTSLRKMFLSGQYYQGVGFHGEVPEFIGTFRNLTVLALGGNSFTGTIPVSLYNLSFLEAFSADFNKLEGTIHPDIGISFPRLQWLQIDENQLTGHIPPSLSNLSRLLLLELGNNNFTGNFLFDASTMHNLSTLDMNAATVGTGKDDDLKFFDTLVNCSSLEIMDFSNNYFGGILPRSVANLSATVRMLMLSNNMISGSIPAGFANLLSLQIFALDSNQLTGSVPAEIGNIPRLQEAYFSDNKLSGMIPTSLGKLSLLSVLDLSRNKLLGKVPAFLGNCTSLLTLDLSQNNLVGKVPRQLFQAPAIIEIYLHQNHLQGSLPTEIGNTRNLVNLVASDNNLSGELPSSLGQCVSLTQLSLDGNSFVGSIPSSFSLLESLQVLDLSRNNFSGLIPNFFSTFPSLVLLNLSYNNFEGKVPTKGRVFNNVSGISVIGNNKLCGGIPELHLTSCKTTITGPPKKETRLSRTLLIVVSVSCALAGLAITLTYLYLLYSRRGRKIASSGSLLEEHFLKVSYNMLLKATKGFSPESLIGAGSFGSVFRGTLLIDGREEIVAVKVMSNQRRASNGFDAECEALRAIRHRNLVGIITACSSIDFQRNDFKALVYEYMPNGSLEKWLHSASEDGQLQNLSLQQRLSIATDVACALDYIHNDCNTHIIHCDLKPDNILLDENMTARVSDFGLAKLLPEVTEQLHSSSSVGVRGTVGYAAPEYGLGSMVSAAGDVYSYGVILLNMMTAVRPTDPMFGGELNLHKLAESALADGLMEIIDSRLEVDDDEEPNDYPNARKAIHEWALGCIKTIVQIGVQCSSELPQDRMDIKDVISKLRSETKRLRQCQGPTLTPPKMHPEEIKAVKRSPVN